MGSSRRGEDRNKTPSPANQPRCDVCRRQSFAESILSCERCITVQHTFCLPNPLVGLPDRRWMCPACSESSLRLYPSRRVKRSNSSAGSGSVGEGGAGGGKSQPSSGVPSSTTQMNGEVNASAIANASSNTNGSTKPKGGKTAAVGAGETTAVAAASATTSSASGSSKRARKSTDNGALTTAKDSKGAVKAAAGQNAAARRERPEQSHRPSNNNLADNEREPLDPGSTVTLFCRRDFRRYLRWKRRELASQDDERRKEEETRARKTLSSIVASST